jgi:hypothetical protein
MVTALKGMYPVLVTVARAENVLSGSGGSEIVTVKRGKNVVAAANPPSKVATASIKANGDIFRLLLYALFDFRGALGNFGPLLDIVASLTLGA